MNNYNNLQKLFAKINHLKKAIELLYWEYFSLGKNNIENLTEEIITLKAVINEIAINKITKELIAEAESEKLSVTQKGNLNLMKNFCNNAAKIPFDLNKAFCKQSLLCNSYARTAQKEQDFSIVKPYFSELISIARKIAELPLAEKTSKYGAFLNAISSEINPEEINELILSVSQFLKTKTEILPIKEERNKNNSKFEEKKVFESLLLRSDRTILEYRENQLIIGNDQLTKIMLEDRPNYKAAELMNGIGKALYLQNLPYAEWRDQPLCRPTSLSMYSAQGFLFSHFFLEDKDFVAKLKFSCPKTLDPSIMGSTKFAALLHLMIRFSLEKSLINGELEVENLGVAWQEDISYYFRIADPKSLSLFNNYEWFNGQFGYYPCYIKGVVIAAQIFYMIKSDHDLYNGGRLSLKKIVGWLINNIYNYGAKYSTEELLKKSTGENLDCRFYKKF